MLDLIVSTLTQGFIYALLSYGVYITYKILDFPDLTVDGSFPLGAAVTALLLVNRMDPYLTLPIAFARADPRQTRRARPARRYYHHDSAFLHQSANCRFKPLCGTCDRHHLYRSAYHGALRRMFSHCEEADRFPVAGAGF